MLRKRQERLQRKARHGSEGLQTTGSVTDSMLNFIVGQVRTVTRCYGLGGSKQRVSGARISQLKCELFDRLRRICRPNSHEQKPHSNLS